MTANYAWLYNVLMKTHASLPYEFGQGWAFPPLRISLMVTYRCNLRCQMCFQNEWRKQNPHEKELTFDEIIRIIEQIPRYTLLTWTGGEPFSRSDMIEILRYATRRNPCNLLTNGTLLGEQEVKALVDSGVRLVGVSLDGEQKKHDEIRGQPGCYQKTIHAVQRLQKYKAERKKRFPLVDIKTMILPSNLDELPHIFDLAAQLQADFFTLSLAFGDLQFNPSKIQDLATILEYPKTLNGGLDGDLLSRQLQKLVERRSNFRLRIYPDMETKYVTRYCGDPFDANHYQPCKFPWSHFWLSPTGQVFPCLSYEIGNIREQGLGQIVNNQRFRDFRKAIKQFGVVPSCAGCCYLEQKRNQK